MGLPMMKSKGNDKIKTDAKTGPPANIFVLVRAKEIWEEVAALFRTWVLVIYESKSLFAYFYNISSTLTVQTTLLYGLIDYKIDSKTDRIMNPGRYFIEVGVITAALLTFAFDMIRSGLWKRYSLDDKIGSFDFTGVNIIDDLVLTIFILIFLIFHAVFVSIMFRFVLGKEKSTFRNIFDLFTYTICSWTLAISSMFPVLVILSSILLAIGPNLPVAGETDSGQFSFSKLEYFVLFVFWGIYMFFMMYFFIELNIRTILANPIIVLCKIFHHSVFRVIFVYVVTLMLYTVSVNVLLFMVWD